MPGERVTFEIGYEGRRMIARNVRPFGEDKHTQAARGSGHVLLCFRKVFPFFSMVFSLLPRFWSSSDLMFRAFRGA